MSDPQELHIATRFGKLAALQWGEAGAPPLLALHGWLDNAASFGRVAPLLAAHRRVIALDLPGHGHSAHLPDSAYRYHLIDQVDITLDCANALGLERFDLLGHSLGAGIASLVATATPRRIRKLALVEGLGPLADDGSQTLSRWREAHTNHQPPRRAPRLFASAAAAVAARVAAGGLEPAEARPIVERNLQATTNGFLWRSDRRLRLATPLRIAEQPLRQLLAGIEAATLLLLAEPATPYLPTMLMDARVACVSNLRVEHMAGPHHLHIRHPWEVAARIAEFMDE